jgi:hypothetical protein
MPRTKGPKTDGMSLCEPASQKAKAWATKRLSMAYINRVCKANPRLQSAWPFSPTFEQMGWHW